VNNSDDNEITIKESCTVLSVVTEEEKPGSSKSSLSKTKITDIVLSGVPPEKFEIAEKLATLELRKAEYIEKKKKNKMERKKVKAKEKRNKLEEDKQKREHKEKDQKEIDSYMWYCTLWTLMITAGVWLFLLNQEVGLEQILKDLLKNCTVLGDQILNIILPVTSSSGITGYFLKTADAWIRPVIALVLSILILILLIYIGKITYFLIPVLAVTFGRSVFQAVLYYAGFYLALIILFEILKLMRTEILSSAHTGRNIVFKLLLLTTFLGFGAWSAYIGLCIFKADPLNAGSLKPEWLDWIEKTLPAQSRLFQ